MPMSPKRKRQLESDKGPFKDFPVQLWLDYTPYRNSSEETKRELNRDLHTLRQKNASNNG